MPHGNNNKTKSGTNEKQKYFFSPAAVMLVYGIMVGPGRVQTLKGKMKNI